MIHTVKKCNNTAQDSWAHLYIILASKLDQQFGLDGRATVREAIRRYAQHLGSARRQELLDAGCHPNIATLFADGFGFPIGERCQKEWIRNTEEELFLNVAACPYALIWNVENRELGRIFCEEYYPVLLRSGTAPQAQNNLGQTLLSGRDNICRLSMYLRPANVSQEQRLEMFSSFDDSRHSTENIPPYTPDYEELKTLLVSCFTSAAEELLGNDAAQTLISLATENLNSCPVSQQDN